MIAPMMTLLTFLAAILLSAARCAGQGEESYDEPRRRMVEDQLRGRDIVDPEVLEAMGRVPRHRFVPEALRFRAYADHPLPIGSGQTISQPYIVALMTQLAEVEPGDVVLEVGTGSGYQAAVLSDIVKEVYTIEIVPELAETAKTRLAELAYRNVTVRTGDGYLGWKEKAPFDAILVTAAPPEVPPPLVEQLAPGAILVIPVGEEGRTQSLLRIQKTADGSTVTREVLPVVFVPLVRKPR
jgi:protein-L-isoaspartate(D-aspartate) O-methyltransferase